jgi:hypothetical protein
MHASPDLSTSALRPGQRACLIAAVGLMMAFYTWTVSTTRWTTQPRPDSGYYYALMSNAFLAGQLDLLIKPAPALLALPDPYDPAANEGLRVHDANLYKNKYYLNYGPVPALILFMPFRALSGLDFSEPLAVGIFCSLALLFEVLIVVLLTRRFLPETPFWLLVAAVPALGFGNGLAFLARRPLHYEVAIASGQAFVFAAIYFYLAGTLGERVHRRWILIGSILLGLAGGARFPMYAAGLIPLVLFLKYVVEHHREPWIAHVRMALTFFAAIAVCVFFLGLYNYLRFDSWTEFGFKYTLQAWKSARTYKFLDSSHVLPGLFYYLLCPPYVNAVFPFFHNAPGMILGPNENYYLEYATGLFPTAPVSISLLASPFILWQWRRGSLGPLALATTASLAVGSALLGFYAFWAAIYRYQVDFATFWLIPAILFWGWAISVRARTDWRRTLLAGTFVVSVVLTVAIGVAYSLAGVYDLFRLDYPAQFEAIHAPFRPIERLFETR